VTVKKGKCHRDNTTLVYQGKGEKRISVIYSYNSKLLVTKVVGKPYQRARANHTSV